MYEKRKKRNRKKKNPKIYLEPESTPGSRAADNIAEDDEDNEDNEDNESGFEVNSSNKGHFSELQRLILRITCQPRKTHLQIMLKILRVIRMMRPMMGPSPE